MRKLPRLACLLVVLRSVEGAVATMVRPVECLPSSSLTSCQICKYRGPLEGSLMTRRGNTMRKVISLSLLPGLLWLWSSFAAAQDLKIGYVDLQRALNESQAGKSAKERFQGEVSRAEQSLEKRKGELEKLKDELEKKG